MLKTYRGVAVGYYAVNGDLLVTAEHPFLVDGKWVTAERLRVGDRLMDVGGKEAVISSVEYFDRGVRVFNIDVMAPHTFFAGGMLVHKKPPDPQG